MGQLQELNLGNGTKDVFSYYDQTDPNGEFNYRLKTIQTFGRQGQEYFKNEFGYRDGNGKISPNITSIKDPRFGNQTMTYDYLNRLTSAVQSAPTATDKFQPANGQEWLGYGVKIFNYADNGNIISRTKDDPQSTDILTYTYAPSHPHAVKEIKTNGTAAPVWQGQYDDNGSLTHKNSSLNPEATPDQHYIYDSDGRMTAVLTLQMGTTVRISDSFYHLQGGRLFEGQLANHFVQGSLFINPYYELKVTNGVACTGQV